MWFFDWERHIPFVAITIVPYMSIDIFFVLAPFLCSTRDELRILCRRIGLSILIAGACFLSVPLEMGFPRPETSGWAGALFRLLHGFDQPYNLFPSLHIALGALLATFYVRHTRGWVRNGVRVWFGLIYVSTLLTFQHHTVDVVGGFILALGCHYLVRERVGVRVAIPTIRVGFLYFGGAMLVTGTAYCCLGPCVFRKNKGRLPLSAKVLLAPTLLGQKLSLLYYRRGCSAWNAITPNIWLGVHLNAREAQHAVARGITAVLDLTAEISEAPAFLQVAYRNIPVLDLTAPDAGQLRDAAQFISTQSERGIVYVHCKVGYSRSAAAVGAYLLKSGRAKTVAHALELLRSARPGIIIRPEIVKCLQQFAADEFHGEGAVSRVAQNSMSAVSQVS